MSVIKDLRDEALRVAREIQDGAQGLQHELSKIETRKLQIEAMVRASSFARERLANFVPEIGGIFQCPSCWVRDELHSPLKPFGRGMATEEYFKCGHCSHEFTINV